MSKPRPAPSRRTTCTDVRFVEVDFPRQLRPRLVIEFSEGLSLLLEDHAAIPLAATLDAFFVFTNNRRNRIKLLYFGLPDLSGICRFRSTGLDDPLEIMRGLRMSGAKFRAALACSAAWEFPPSKAASRSERSSSSSALQSLMKAKCRAWADSRPSLTCIFAQAAKIPAAA